MDAICDLLAAPELMDAQHQLNLQACISSKKGKRGTEADAHSEASERVLESGSACFLFVCVWACVLLGLNRFSVEERGLVSGGERFS